MTADGAGLRTRAHFHDAPLLRLRSPAPATNEALFQECLWRLLVFTLPLYMPVGESARFQLCRSLSRGLQDLLRYLQTRLQVNASRLVPYSFS